MQTPGRCRTSFIINTQAGSGLEVDIPMHKLKRAKREASAEKPAKVSRGATFLKCFLKLVNCFHSNNRKRPAAVLWHKLS